MSIVFSHIPKTAGTSFRVYLYSMFSTDQIFWFKNEEEPFPHHDYFFYGGHRPAWAFDHAIPSSILVSIVREPIERVVSLHRYSCKQITHRAKPGVEDPYIVAGFDPSSIRNSLINCDDFRARCANGQAAFLCGEALAAEDETLADRALEYLRSRPCIVGLQESLDSLLLRLVRHWSWSTLFPYENRSRDFRVNADVYGRPSELAAIKEVCQQDLRMYQALHTSGGFANVTASQARTISLPRFFTPETLERISIERVGVASDLYRLTECAPGQTVEVVFRIKNHGNAPFGPVEGFQINVSYHVKDLHGQALILDGARTALTVSVMPGKSADVVAAFRVPDRPGVYLVEPALVIENVSWIDSARGAGTIAFTIEVTE